MSKRAIAAIAIPDVEPGMTETSAPIYEWLDPTVLRIDPQYQRDLSDASRKLIGKMIARWDWRKFKPPVAVLADDGEFDLLDGQHTAIAAASHPLIGKIPVQIVEAEKMDERAAAFIGINRDRLAVTSAQMHAALIAAGDPAATVIQRVCDAVGVTVLRSSPGAGCFKPRQTIAIAAIGQLIERRGEARAADVLRILAAADCAPIELGQIKAVELLLCDDEFQRLDASHLATTIRDTAVTITREAKAFAETHNVPRWRALASLWFKYCRKQGQAKVTTQPAAPARAAGLPSPALALAADRGGPKRDRRPAKGNWSPGPFARRCQACDETYVGGHSSLFCADCEYSADEGEAA